MTDLYGMQGVSDDDYSRAVCKAFKMRHITRITVSPKSDGEAGEREVVAAEEGAPGCVERVWAQWTCEMRKSSSCAAARMPILRALQGGQMPILRAFAPQAAC